jgi:hypothetical protein
VIAHDLVELQTRVSKELGCSCVEGVRYTDEGMESDTVLSAFNLAYVAAV